MNASQQSKRNSKLSKTVLLVLFTDLKLQIFSCTLTCFHYSRSKMWHCESREYNLLWGQQFWWWNWRCGWNHSQTITWSPGLLSSYLPIAWASSTTSRLLRALVSQRQVVLFVTLFSLYFFTCHSHVMSPYMAQGILPQKWKPSKSRYKMVW